ncbi:MAG: ABC transporter permease subunit [Chloroflexi bacterium]|jgi:ABC-2 type transport system permease protein|nr:ABC transporter permease subunit [Chloroflexota bacterium]
MWAEFLYHLRRLRGRIIGWGIGIGLYGLMMAWFYDAVTGMGAELGALLASYPQEMLAFFGNVQLMNTPAGYLDTYYFSYMTMIVGILAASAAAGMVAGDEERGVLDLVLAHPISRTALFWARLLAVVAALALVLLISWLSWLPAIPWGMEITALELLRPFLPLLAVLLFIGTLALLLSLVLPSSRLAATLAAAAIVANFLLVGLANMNDDLQPVLDWTPLGYYQGGLAVNGLEWSWLLSLLGVSLLFALLAWLLFQRRDIRVGGERSWRMPRSGRRREAASET